MASITFLSTTDPFTLFGGTYDLLPEEDGKCHCSPAIFAQHAVRQPINVAAQIFPRVVGGGEESKADGIPSGIALSQSMAQSVDHWDATTFELHFAFLDRLTRQTQNLRTQNTADLNSLLSVLDRTMSFNG